MSLKLRNVNMLPNDGKRSKNYFHKKCTSFTSKKTAKYLFSDDFKKSISKELQLAQS